MNAKSRIYLMSGRKQWYHNVPETWNEIAWERFEYVECAIFEKDTDLLTDEDKELIKNYSEVPDDWISPL